MLTHLDRDFREEIEAALRLRRSPRRPTRDQLAFLASRAVTAHDVLVVWHVARQLADDAGQPVGTSQARAAEGHAARILVEGLPSGVGGALAAEAGTSWLDLSEALEERGIGSPRPTLAAVAQHLVVVTEWFNKRLRDSLRQEEG